MERYQNYIDQLVLGKHYGVFIDDTGSPDLQSTPTNLHPERKSWVGIVVTPSQMPEIMTQFPKAIKELHDITGANEFHFCDIYAGRKEFKNIDLQKRLAIFRFMAEIFKVYNLPIFVQTLDPTTLKDIRQRASFPEVLGLFNLKNYNDLALFFLLIRIKLYLEKSRLGLETARVFIDEGFKKNGAAIHIPIWESVFSDGLICFASSSSILPIQLADFAAFTMNRTQLIVGKPILNSLDVELLKILTPIAWNFQNIEKRSIKLI